MANLNEIPELTSGTLVERSLVVDTILDGQGAEAISDALTFYDSSNLHLNSSTIMNSSFLKSKNFTPGSAQYRADRARWVKQVEAAAKLKLRILRGEFKGNPIADSYSAWMSLSTAGRARSIIANMYFSILEIDNSFTPTGAALLATAAAYSYLGEGECDPLAAENWIVSAKGASFRPYAKNAAGTGLGFQQWSFYRQDDLILNLEKWSVNKNLNALGTILPSPTIQFMFAAKEVINQGPRLVEVCNKKGASIHEVLAHFLHIQNGPGYKGVCIKRLLKSRGKLNDLKVVSGELVANMDLVFEFAKNINPAGKACPNVG